MSAKFGKQSIVCFVGFFFALAILVFAMTMRIFMNFDVISLFILMFLTLPMIPSWGCWLGYLSMRERETPKCYRYIGLSLNAGLLLLMLAHFVHVIYLFCTNDPELF